MRPSAESQAAEASAAAAATSSSDDARGGGGGGALAPGNVPRAPLSRSGSISSSSGGGGVSAASHGWMIDWQHRWQLEHRYGVSTDSSPMATIPPVPIEAPEPPSPPVTPPIEVDWVGMDGGGSSVYMCGVQFLDFKIFNSPPPTLFHPKIPQKREAIDDSTGDNDDGQPPGDGSGGVEGGPQHHSGSTTDGGSVVGSLQGSPTPTAATTFLGGMATPTLIRSETKGTMGAPTDGSVAAPSLRPGEAEDLSSSEGPSLADQPLLAAAPVARRMPPLPVPSRPSQRQQPPAAPTAPASLPGRVGNEGLSTFFPVQRSNSGGRQPVPQWAAKAAAQEQQPQPQQQHGRGPSLSSSTSLTASTSSSALSSSLSSGPGAGGPNPRFKV